MSAEQTYLDLRRHISSPESGYGLTPSAELACLMSGLSGPEAVLANLSPRQAKELGLLTSGTYGQRSTISSASAVLTVSLASRLRRLTASVGSRVYRLTWKQRAMPSGRSIPALRASPPRKATKGSTSDSASTGEQKGWNTPRATDGANGGPNQAGGALSHDASLCGWATPTTRDHKDGDSVGTVPVNGLLGRQAWLVGWATPKATDGSGGRTTETQGGGNVHLDKQARLTGSPAETGSIGRLRAGHSRWLMRIPREWDDCVPTETPSTLRKRKAS